MLKTVDARVHGSNQYHVLHEVGKGGFGVIHTVRSETNQHIYVQKKVSKKDPRIAREVLSLSRMQTCKGVVKLHDVFEDQDHTYMIMDKGWKDIAATHTQTYNTCTEADVQRILAHALKVLAQGHAQGIIHLDVKGGNFLWKDENQTELMAIDWGLSSELRPSQPYIDQKDFSGTPWFMAPEQLRSEATDKSDVWAIGVLAYQMLMGKFPFNDKQSPHHPSVAAIWRSILLDEIAWDAPKFQHLSAEVRDFLRCTLTKDPTQRPSALALLQHPWLWPLVKSFDVHEGRKQRFAWYGKILGYCMDRVAQRVESDGMTLSSSNNDLRDNPLVHDEVRALFETLDLDGDGVLGVEDFRALLQGWQCMEWEERAELSRIEYWMDGKAVRLEDFERWLLARPSLPTFLFG